MSIVGVDVGWKRIGIAIAEDCLAIALPKTTLTLTRPGSIEETVSQLSACIQNLDAHTVVIGLPKHLNGTLGKSADHARQIAAKLSKLPGLTVALWDERLTTKQAKQSMNAAGADRKSTRQIIDQVAASIILQSYLDSKQP